MTDRRSENWLKKVPTLIEQSDGWLLDGFEPTSPAFNYPDIRDKDAFIYGFHCDGMIKIGRSSCPVRRLGDLSRGWRGPPLEIIRAERVPYAGSIYAERLMHIQFEDNMLKREWFEITPADFLEFLPYAVIGAEMYDMACREWHADPKSHARSYRRRRRLFHDCLPPIAAVPTSPALP